MARFDIYAHKPISGYLLDVQSNLVDGTRTRAVVPLMPLRASAPPVRKLHPVFEVEGEAYLMHTHLLASVPQRELRMPIGSLRERRDDIMAAIDILFTGF